MKRFLHSFSVKTIGLFTCFLFLLVFANAQVVNTTHPANSPYATIQAAIDDAITTNGDIITVGSGTYNESINITKSVNLRGAQADNCALNRAGAESIISCPNGIGINASNVTLNGFTIQDQDGANTALAPGYGFAVYMVPPNTGTQLLNNIIRNNTLGTGLSNAGAVPAQVKISCNWYDANNTVGPTFREAIYADDDISGGTVKNVLIDNNKFSNHVQGVGIDFEMSTAATAATGITMTNNVFDGNLRAVTFYNVASSTFSNNEIKNSTFGGTSADLRIFGGANNLIVHNNSFDGSNALAPHAIRMTSVVGPNSNISFFENSFTGYNTTNTVFLAPQSYTGGPIPATCNWFGTADAATIASTMGSPVSYIPYLTNGTDAMPARGFQPVAGSCNGNNQPPSITCPQDVTLDCGDGIPNPDVESVIVSGSCPVISVTWEGDAVINQTCASSFTIVRTYKATDACGNIATCTQTITVVDNTPPTLTVPANVTLQCGDTLPLMPLNINSSPNFIDGTYNVGTAVFGAPLTSTPVTADAVLVNDGIGGAGNPYDACESIINDLTGKIAVIERSGCTPPASYFVTKANKAQLAGAVGVVFIFNQPGDQVVTMGLPEGPNPTITIPLMLVSNNYGNILKAELLAGAVNVSLSAPTVIATDACSFTTITHQQTFTAGNCPSNYTIVNTWTATDQCGNATTASQTITGVDNTPPTLTVPANVTLQCTDPLPLMPLNINSSPNFIDGTYNIGTAVFGAPLTATPLTANAVMVIDDAGNPYDACENITNDLTGKIAVIERSGCTPPASYFVTKANKAQLAGAVGVIFIFNQPGNQVVTMGLPAGPNPTINIPLMLVSNNYGNTLKAEILAGPVNVSLSAPTVIATDECSFTTITHQQTFTPGNCPSNYTIVNTWTATDQCGNATTASQTIIGIDNTPPALTVPANVTLQCSDTMPLMPLNINSSPNFIDGTYNVGTAVFGAPLTSTPVTADAVLVNDGIGGAGNPYDACESIINDLTGKIAVIERSGCVPPASYFVTKANKAQLAGAVGVIFIFNQPGDQVATMGLPAGPNPTITIPLMLVSNNYGNILKAELLAGAVNVSLSAPTVIATDACSFATITHQQTFTPGNCPSSYTLLNTWTATDLCGNATTASQTITVADNTPPTLTVPANVTLQCGDPLPLKPLNINSSPNSIDGTYNVGTAVFGAPLTATPLTADAVMVIDNAGNPYDACDTITNNLTGKIAVIERSGCTPPASYFVTKANKAQLAGAVGVIFIFNQPGDQVATMGLPAGPNPTIAIPLMLVSNNYGNTLKAEILAGPVNVSLSAPTVIATDACSFATITHQQTFIPGNCPSSYTLVNTWTATDQCGNATTASQTIIGPDTTAPTLTIPANVTLQCGDPLPLMPLNINSSPNFIDGTYNIGTAVFGAPLTSTPLTADAVLVNDGTGGAGNPYDACESIIGTLTGKIAVIERSGCLPPESYFVNKAYKAQLAGAVGVIFIFNQPGNQVVTMGLPAGPNPTITIPLMLVSNDYGNILKAELLAGAVNVSLSAPTVIATDECSFATITHQQTFTPGICPSSYTLVNTWTATDQCGNATTASQTITVEDNTPPTLTVPANVTLQCGDPLPLMPLNINSSPNFIDGTYNIGTAVFGAPLTSTPLTADAVLVNDGTGGAGNPYDACESIIGTLTGKIAVIERSGCTPPASYFVTKANKAQLAGAVGVIFIFNQPGDQVATMGLPAGPNPTITIPLMLVSNDYGNILKAELLAGAVNVSLSAPTVIATDECSFATITHQQTFTPGICPSSYTLVNTWTATDQCGNATTASQTITVEDNTPPTLTVPANVTLQCGDPLPLMPLNINSSPNFIDGTYNIGTAVFGAPLTSTPLTADAVLVNDGTGGAGNPYDACESIIGTLTGKIAVIERSGCTPPASYFVTKANKAQLAGAVGVIFIFNQPGDQVATMGLPAGPNPTITIPLMLVSNNYGNILKAELLAGAVNVSLSAPTVIATDACSFATIAHQQTFTPGICPSSYTLVNTWTATDQCGNATTASQTITVADNTAPTLTVPANVTLHCGDPLPLMPLNINSSPNFIDGTYNVGTAVFGAPLTSTPLTADAVLVNDGTGGAGNPYDACESIIGTLTGKIAVIERSGCTPPASYFVTKANKAQLAGAVGVIFIFNQPGNQVVTMGLPAGPNPTITIPLMLVSNSYGNTLKAEILAGPVNVSLSAPTVIATDTCSFTTITHQQTFTPGNCPSNYTLVNTWTATDQCGNATTASQTITVVDNTAPVVSCKANQTRLTNNGYCTYTAVGTEFNVLSATDNCPGAVGLSFTLSGATLGSGSTTLNGVTFNTGVTTVTWKATDGCGNFATCSFNITVNDNQNNTGYIIYAKSLAKFGEENDINGDVGVTDANGSAEFKKNTDLNPFFVKAKNITVQMPANVSNRFYTPATGGPNPPFMIYNGTGGSGTLNANVNGTYNGNYKNLTVKKGVTATITGNDFGKVKIEEGANVTFTATIINMQEMSVEKGKKNVNTTNVYFANPSSVKVSEKITVEADCRINVNGPKVTFYLGDNKKDEEKFSVTGDNTMVTLNIMIPNGKLKVSGGPRYGTMTGWFITEKIESTGKKTTWNKYECFVTLPFAKGSYENVEPEIKEKPIEIEAPVVADPFAVKIYPNPTPGDFNIQVITKSNEPIMVRIMDVNGTLVQASTRLTKQGLIALANKLPGGTYFVEVTQGKNHSVTKLIKLN